MTLLLQVNRLKDLSVVYSVATIGGENDYLVLEVRLMMCVRV